MSKEMENTKIPQNIVEADKVEVKPDLELREKAEKLRRTYIVTSYVTGQDLAIAKINPDGEARIATEVTNKVDWKKIYLRDFVVSDVIVTGTDYLKRVKKLGEGAQNILDMMTKGEYSYLGDWREKHGLKREPDMAILSRSLDLDDLPDQLFTGGRNIMVFTTDEMANSEKADELRKKGIKVIASGNEGADGERVAGYFDKEMHYKVAMMATGPRVLDVFMKAGEMDEVHINEVDRNIPGKVVTVLPDGKNFDDYGYTLVSKEGPENIKTNDGAVFPQSYLTWVRNQTLAALKA